MKTILAQLSLLLTILLSFGPAEGKPRPPFSVTSSLEGDEVRANALLPIAFHVVPSRDYEAIAISIRGLEGVTVSKRGAEKHGAGRAGKAVDFVASVKVPDRVAGYAVIDVVLTAGGKKYGASTPFLVRAPGAALKRNDVGQLGTDASGKPIMVLKASPPPRR